MGAASYKHPSLVWPTRNSGTVRKCVFIFIALIVVIIFFYYTQFKIHAFENELVLNYSKARTANPAQKYLIHTPKCRIPDDDPFNEEVKKFYYPEEPIQCSKKPLLSYVEKHDVFVTLRINQSLLDTYSVFRISCCYSNVSRMAEARKPDDEIRFSDCRHFEHSVNVTSPLILVKCRTSLNTEIYSNVHSILTLSNVADKKPKERSRTSAFSVLFVGIDSVSKMNLVRTMPKTYRFLEGHDFINLKGYTKIGDNTFPNWMAILTGKFWTQVYQQCDPTKNKWDNCEIIWDIFRQSGYVTAYAEDESSISTFNYEKQGFDQPPTTLYFRPYILAAEKLPSIKRFNMHICSGPETSGERILNLVKDFQYTFQNIPKFGWFWMNSFSHDNLNLPSSMDAKVEIFLKDIYKHLNNTILIFFSDHGFRFGDIRYTHTGWLEERLPFIYVHFPETFKQRYPQEFNNFQSNSRRLSTPFDLYMTLQDILYFSNHSYSKQRSLGCPKCHSLFEEISEARTCKDAAIEQHWCLCSGHSYISSNRKIVVDTAEFIVSEINQIFKSSPQESSKCAFYLLRRIVSSGMSEEYLNEHNETVNYFLIMLETRPPAIFEATVEVNMKQRGAPSFRLLGDISRTNRYRDNSKCIKGFLQKYCYCDGLFTSIKSAVCNFFSCV